MHLAEQFSNYTDILNEFINILSPVLPGHQ